MCPPKKTFARKKTVPEPPASLRTSRGTGLPSRFDPEAARDALTRQTQAVARLEPHTAGGFGTIEAYAESALGISRTTASQSMRVSQAFSEDVAASFGIEKLDRGLAYIAKTPEDDKPSQIPTLVMRAPDADGKERRKKFSQTTIVKLKRAVQRESAHATGRRRRGEGRGPFALSSPSDRIARRGGLSGRRADRRPRLTKVGGTRR